MVLACDPAGMSHGQGASVPVEVSDVTEVWLAGFQKVPFTKLLQRRSWPGPSGREPRHG